MNPGTLARVEKRLADIKRTKDEGLYARFYTEDITALLAEIGALQQVIDASTRTGVPR